MTTRAPRDLIALSDGTGNSASKPFKTNVWRLYQALNLRDGSQVAVFGDGVGNSTITFPGGDGSNRGFLIYIKPAILGEEPRDVLQYAAGHPAFPHQTTVDPFFDESQFESYRKLGEHIVESLCGDATSVDQNLAEFVGSIYSKHLKRKPSREVKDLVRDL